MEISLALGGGGSKGYAHLGVIRGLENEGFRIKAIAGTSAGGMAGSTFVAGYSPDEVIQKISNISQETLFGFGRDTALLANKGIRAVLSQFLGEKNFSDLDLPFAVTAVDLVSMEEVVLTDGKVLDAVLATIAIPGVLPPQERNQQVLVDGMVLNPVPVQVARSLAPDLPVIAVSLSPEPERWKVVSPWDRKPANPLLRPISRLRIAKAFDIYMRSMDITLHMLGEKRLELEEPDLLIRPDVFHIGSLDRVDIPAVADLGEQAVRDALPGLKSI
jgi:NTE family protein